MVGTASIVIVTGVPRALRTERGETAVHEGIGARLVDGGRRGRGDAAPIGIGALAVMLFAIVVTQSHRDRAGPVVDRRTLHVEAEGFLARGLDRIRTYGGAAGAVLAVDIGDLAGLVRLVPPKGLNGVQPKDWATVLRQTIWPAELYTASCARLKREYWLFAVGRTSVDQQRIVTAACCRS